MAPPRIRKVFSGFAPDLQIDLKGPCTFSDTKSHCANVGGLANAPCVIIANLQNILEIRWEDD